MNAVIRAVVRKSVLKYNYQVLGILKGWLGLMEYGLTEELNLDKVSGIIHGRNSIRRCNPTENHRILCMCFYHSNLVSI